MNQPGPPSATEKEILGVLINNLGTPDSYQVRDVRKFLKEFLWDPRVVKLPRFIWWFVLNVIILNTRPKVSAKAYRKIWSRDGSPLAAISRNLTDLIRQSLNETHANIVVELGMRYGNPSIESALTRLRDSGASRFLILPLYPQYSFTTTASVEDEVSRASRTMGIQDIKFVKPYFSNPDYIDSLSGSVKSCWDEHGKADLLLMSFHGIPQQYSDDGDPYQEQCKQTAELLAGALDLASPEWKISFQSRLGPKKWLEPYTDKVLRKLASTGIQSVQVLCPGFSSDCLETLEEIAMENRDVFIESGGKDYHYIPCLNDTDDHVRMLKNLILENMQ